MRIIYTLLFYLLLPFILLRLLWRARKAPAYAKRWSERFGFIPPLATQTSCIWIHAVSLGEVLAAIPLIKALLIQHPTKAIAVTTLTPTGSERVKALLGDSVYHVYAPYDFPGAIKRFLRQVQPEILIIMETELWPNIIYQCAQHHIPIVLANGRLSASSAQGYARFQRLTTQILGYITQIAVQTQPEAARFIQLKVPAERITITGNIKFDLEIPETLSKQAAALKAQWGHDRPVWIAASTHHGEDELILAVFAMLKQRYPSLLLLLVPRHPERFNPVATLCQQQGFSLIRRSTAMPVSNSTDIYLGDTLGELLLLYQTADIAFVGGSLIPSGGHNLLEPAALGIPSITGPHMFNFSAIHHLLQTAGATFTITQAKELQAQIDQLLANPVHARLAGQKGQAVVAANRGSLQQHLTLINNLLIKKSTCQVQL